MFQQHISNPPGLLYPLDPIEGELYNTAMFPDNAMLYSGQIPFAPVITEYFEWDLANLWSYGRSS